MLFDLDEAKEQFLHSYPLLTLNIEAPFARNVKVIMRTLAIGNLQRHLLSSAERSVSFHERGASYEAWRIDDSTRPSLVCNPD
jgi:hypothetical protein